MTKKSLEADGRYAIKMSILNLIETEEEPVSMEDLVTALEQAGGGQVRDVVRKMVKQGALYVDMDLNLRLVPQDDVYVLRGDGNFRFAVDWLRKAFDNLEKGEEIAIFVSNREEIGKLEVALTELPVRAQGDREVVAQARDFIKKSKEAMEDADEEIGKIWPREEDV